MSRDVIVPPARALLVDGGNVASRPYYTFFNALATSLKDLSAAVDDVTTGGGESPFSPNANVTGAFSIYTQGILKTGIVRVLLTGDVEQPGHRWYYGSDNTGERGWFAIGDAFADSGNIVKTTNSDGITSFDLADLADSGEGSLLAVTRDGKGRVSGTRDATITGTDGHIAVANGNASAGLPTIDLDAGLVALIDFLKAVAPNPRVTSDGSYRMTADGAYRVTA